MSAAPEVIVFPDVGDVLLTYLRDELGDRGDDALVVSKVPAKNRPTRLVLVRRLGGPRANLVTDNATIGVECFDDDMVEALHLAQLCRALLIAATGAVLDGVTIGRVGDVGGPAELPDPVTDSPRVIATFVVPARGAAETGS